MIGAMASIPKQIPKSPKLCKHNRQQSQCKDCGGAAILSGLRAKMCRV